MGLSDIFVDPASFPHDAYGKIQLLFMLVVYGFILSKSSAMISDGSELLLLIPALAGIVGSVVLPVLGAVPDGAIVLFSGMGTKDEVAAQIGVGVGALAGSTIMLLTIPWALCIVTGRVDIVNGVANYRGKPKLTEANKWGLFGSGITPRKSVAFNAKIMIATALSYVIIQGSAFTSHCDLKDEKCNVGGEHWAALVALLTTIAFFIGYMVYNIKTADSEDKEDFIAEVKKQAIESHIMSLSSAFEADFNVSTHEAQHLNHDEKKRRFDDALKSFYLKYDRNGDGVIDVHELRFLLKDIGEDMSEDRFQALLKEIDTDNSGNISFTEFAVAMRSFIQKKNELIESGDVSMLSVNVQVHHSVNSTESVQAVEGEIAEKFEEEEEEEEEEEIPEDIAALPPHKQKVRILLRSGWMMGLGTLIVLVFSDPMVDVLNELGNRFNVNSFYVAFVLAPVASNASELIASIAYAMKKTKKTITISLAALEGAACMNNTFCLGIFLVLIFAKEIPWAFSAETISIFFVEAALFGLAQFQTHKLIHAIIIISLYPASIFLVWFLENVAHLN